jgi:DNA invertase Pin-like site-specific DNA recombinase
MSTAAAPGAVTANLGHVAVYARVSRDPEGRRVSLDRQVENCRADAERLWPNCPHIEVYADNDLSGSGEVERPEWDRLAADIEAGRVFALIANEQSRLVRDLERWAAFVKFLYRQGVHQVFARDKGWIGVLPGMRLAANVNAVVDQEERERTVVRVRDAHEKLAREGRPSGGKLYGYKLTRDEHGRAVQLVDPDEAATIRRMADLAIRGVTLGEIARTLNVEGIPTARGGTEWRRQSVRSVLTAPAVAGLRAHRRGASETLYPASWEPILDEAEWRKAHNALASDHYIDPTGRRRKVSRRRASKPRRYLLTGGLARCGRCGSLMTASLSPRRHAPGVRAYQCRDCKLSISSAETVEVYVVEAVLTLLEDSAVVAALAQDSPSDERRGELLEELAACTADLLDIARAKGAGELTKAEWQVMRGELVDRQRRAEAELDRLDKIAERPSLQQVRDRWSALTLAERRAVIGAVIAKVTVAPAKPGTKSFDPERLTLVPVAALDAVAAS